MRFGNRRGGARGGEVGGNRDSEWIYGRRPVLEVVRAARRQVFEAVIQDTLRDMPELDELRAALAKVGAHVRIADRDALDSLTLGGHHQGVALRTGPFPYAAYEDILEQVRGDEHATVLFLDHVEDPQNVGSLLRSADASGVTAVVIPEDRASGVTSSAVRASAGASEHVPVCRVVNLVRAMKDLQACGAWLTGLDMGPDAKPYTEIDFAGRTGLVVGSEGAGISRLARETCDFIACLPMKGRVESLNAGVAGGIAMYEILRQKSLPAHAKRA